jgi:hypothetical protein
VHVGTPQSAARAMIGAYDLEVGSTEVDPRGWRETVRRLERQCAEVQGLREQLEAACDEVDLLQMQAAVRGDTAACGRGRTAVAAWGLCVGAAQPSRSGGELGGLTGAEPAMAGAGGGVGACSGQEGPEAEAAP